MRVTTRDGWTTRVGGRLRTVGNEVSIGFSFLEDNFLGTASRAGVSFSADPVRTAFALEASKPRFLGSNVGIGVRWEDRSDGTVIRGRVIRPFYSVTDARGFSINADYRDETVYQYLGGVDEPVDTLDHVMGAIRTTAAWAVSREKRRYTRVGALAHGARQLHTGRGQGPIPETIPPRSAPSSSHRVRYVAREFEPSHAQGHRPQLR
jgi:hypothetical protein